MEPDLDAVVAELGVGVHHHPDEFYSRGIPSSWIHKALRIGALDEKPLGPRKGARWAITSVAAWGLLKQWRGALALGARQVRDDALKLR